MEKTYRKISDTEGEIVNTMTSTVTLADLQGRKAELENKINDLEANAVAEEATAQQVVADLRSQKIPFQDELDAVNADIEGLVNAGVSGEEETSTD